MSASNLHFSFALTTSLLVPCACTDIPIGEAQDGAETVGDDTGEGGASTVSDGENPGVSGAVPAGTGGREDSGSGGAGSDAAASDGAGATGAEGGAPAGGDVIEMTFAQGYAATLTRACTGQERQWIVYQAPFGAVGDVADFCADSPGAVFFRAQFPAGDNVDPWHDPATYDLSGQDAEYCVDETCRSVSSGSLTLETGGAGLFALSGDAVLEDGTLLLMENPNDKPIFSGESCAGDPSPACW